MLINSWLAFVKKTLQKSHSHCPSKLDRSRRRRSVNAQFAAESLEDRVLLAATFAPAVHYGGIANSSAMQAADLGNDGNIDLVVASAGSGSVSVLIANGDGTYQPAVDYSVGAAPVAIVVADFDGDNKLDVVTGNFTSKDLSLLRGNGDGTFQPVVHFALPFTNQSSNNPSSVATGDFDLDGKPDLALSYNTTSSKTVTVLLNDDLDIGGGVWPASNFNTGHSRTPDVLVSDFNGDNKPDLVVSTQIFGFEATETLSVVVLPGNGDGTFGAPIDTPFLSQPQQNYPQGMALGDFNDDGKVDVVTANYHFNKATVLLGNGNGTFQTPVTYNTGETAYGVAVGDFDHDGNEDLAVTDVGDNTVSLLLGNGNGTFQPRTTLAVGQFPTAVVAADLNGDCKIDLSVTNAGSNTVSVMLNTTVGDVCPEPPAPVTLSIGDASVAEGNVGTTVLSFPVMLSSPVDAAVWVDYATQDGTATTANDDYVAQTGILIIPAGQTEGTIEITVKGDTTVELDEMLSVILSNVRAGGRDVELIGPSSVIYSNDFEGGVADWTYNTTSTELTSVYTEFLGRFGGSTVNSTTINVGTATTVVVSFDMFEFNSWDKEFFQVFADGVLVVNDSFAQEDNYGDYDGTTKPNAISIDNRAPQIPNTFGHLTEIWHYEFTVDTTGPTLELSFGSTLNQSVYDESWGIDNLTLTASISVTSLTATGTIVNDDFNTPPTITSDGGGETAGVNAAENQLAVTDVQATDDNDAESAGLVYSLSGGTDQSFFSIDANTGVLTLNTAPDFENPTDAGGDNVYDVQVTVTDSGLLTDVQDIAVTVTDINEPPVINGGTLAGTITETADAAPGVDADPPAATGTVTFQDPDLADNPSASIVGSSVASTSLALSAAQEAALLDNLTLDPVEFSNVDGSGSVDWTYDVPNSEIDFLGVSDSVQLTYTVEVNDQSGSTGLQTFEGHTYQFITDYNFQSFGAVSAAAASLSFNGVQGHLATITSAAENAFLYNTFRAQVLAEAGAHNDAYPQAWIGGLSPTESTHPTNGWEWVTGEAWSYTNWRAGEPNGWAGVNVSAANMDFASPLRAGGVDAWNDVPSVWHNIEGYIVEWDTAATGATDTVDVVVTINGTNDTPTAPVDDDSANNEVFENAAVGTPVGIDVSSTDVDAGTTIAYSLSDNAAGRFQIDASTGVVTVANASLLNYEDDTSHNITMVADDGSGTANATSSQTFTINVIDVNEAPSVALINITNSLVENTDTSSPVKVADIVVTDDALGTNTLSLNGIDAVMFEISGAELFLKAGSTVDFETNPVLDVTVEVDDSTVGATPDDLAALAINVTDIDPVHLTCEVSDNVQALKDAGELGNGQANPIINHLGQAKASLAKGKTSHAIKKLEQGRDELQDLIDGGGLNAGVVAQLEALVEDLNHVITEIQSGSA